MSPCQGRCPRRRRESQAQSEPALFCQRPPGIVNFSHFAICPGSLLCHQH